MWSLQERTGCLQGRTDQCHHFLADKRKGVGHGVPIPPSLPPSPHTYSWQRWPAPCHLMPGHWLWILLVDGSYPRYSSMRGCRYFHSQNCLQGLFYSLKFHDGVFMFYGSFENYLFWHSWKVIIGPVVFVQFSTVCRVYPELSSPLAASSAQPRRSSWWKVGQKYFPLVKNAPNLMSYLNVAQHNSTF